MLFDPQKSLEEIFEIIVSELEKGCKNKDHPFQTFVLGTIDTAITIPSLRNVIFREFDPEQYTIWFFSDSRSKKIIEIKKNKNVTLLFWNPEEQVQIRIKGNAFLHQRNDIEKQKWHTVKGSAKKLYNSVIAPGENIKNPKEAYQWNEELNDENFTAIQINPYTIEVLQLDKVEHKRVLFIKKSSNKWNKSWIAP